MSYRDAKWPPSNRLKAARELAGLSVEQLAEKTGRGLGRGPIQEIERGQRDFRDAQEIARFAHACGLPVAFFYVDFARLVELMPIEASEPLAQFDEMQTYLTESRKAGVA